MAKEIWGFTSKRELDRATRAIRVVERMEARPKKGRRPKPGGGSEKLRLIRGQSVGAQSGSIILLDNIWVLSGGLDPSDGNPATQIAVRNLFSQSYSDNEEVQAVYSPGVALGADWETLQTSGTEKYRLILGSITADVAPEDTTFNIDIVHPLAGGNDPSGGNPAAIINIQKPTRETLRQFDTATCIYDGVNWELLHVERLRLIRGTVVTAYDDTDAQFDIENVKVLSSGNDPRIDPTDAGEAVLVNNVFLESGDNGDVVFAVFNNVDEVWDALPKSKRANFTLIRGLAKGDVTADDATFIIDNVEALANGADPTAGNPAAEVEVENLQQEAFEDNTPVTCIRNDGDGVWELLLVERYRMIRGEVVGDYTQSDDFFAIDAIKVLCSGVDPRDDPTDATEQISIANIYGDVGFVNDKVVAVFNVQDNQWEALPNGGKSTSGTYMCTLGGAISAGSTANMGTGTGTVYSMTQGTALTSLGTKTINNPFKIDLPATSGGDTIQYTCAKTWHDPDDEADDEYTIIGMDPLHILASLSGFGASKILYSDGTAETNIKWGGTCSELLTDINCVDDEVVGTTTSYIVISCTP